MLRDGNSLLGHVARNNPDWRVAAGGESLVIAPDAYVSPSWYASKREHAREAEQAHPWAVSDAPPQFVAGQLRAIVGLELRMTRIEAKAKLSQNRTAADRAGVIAGLGSHRVAAAMRERN